MVVWKDVGEGKQEVAFPSRHRGSLQAGTGSGGPVRPVPQAGWTCGSSDPSPGQSHWCHISSLTVPPPCLGAACASRPAPTPAQRKEPSRTSQDLSGVTRLSLCSPSPLCHVILIHGAMQPLEINSSLSQWLSS